MRPNRSFSLLRVAVALTVFLLTGSALRLSAAEKDPNAEELHYARALTKMRLPDYAQIVLGRISGSAGDLEKVKASLGVLNKSRIAIVEMAQASGLIHVPVSKRDPLRTTSYGTGELLKQAINHLR